MAKRLRVRAKGNNEDKKYVGYYNYVRRKPGDVFDLLKESDFSSKWMEWVHESTPKTEAPGEPTPAEIAAEQERQRKASGQVSLGEAGQPPKPNVGPKEQKTGGKAGKGDEGKGDEETGESTGNRQVI